MAVRAVSRFTVQSTSEDWLVHALVGEVIDRLREQRSVQMAFATWPAPDMLQVHTRHQGHLFGPPGDLMISFEDTLLSALDGHAVLDPAGTDLLPT